MKFEPVCLRSRSVETTAEIARSLAPYLESGTVLALDGGLGAGKTHFVRAVAEGMGLHSDEVSSPTFTIVQEYPGELPLYHFDVYRLASAQAFRDLGLEEYFHKAGISLIEWASLIEDALPEDRIILTITIDEAEPEHFGPVEGPLVLPEDTRERLFCFRPTDEKAAQTLLHWRSSAAFPEELMEDL